MGILAKTENADVWGKTEGFYDGLPSRGELPSRMKNDQSEYAPPTPARIESDKEILLFRSVGVEFLNRRFDTAIFPMARPFYALQNWNFETKSVTTQFATAGSLKRRLKVSTKS